MATKKDRLDRIIQSLRKKGYRLSPQRLAILKILAQSREHPSVAQIRAMIKADFSTTSPATVYKNVSLLKSMGEVLELGFGNKSSRYDGYNPHPHPHVICNCCGRIVDPEYKAMARLSREISRKTGFRITSHRLDFFGLCSECQNKKKQIEK